MASVINARQVGTGAILQTNQIWAISTNFYLQIRFHAHSKEPRANPADYEAFVRWGNGEAWERVATIIQERNPDLRFAPYHLFAITAPHVYGMPGSQLVMFRVRNKRTGHVEESQIWRPLIRTSAFLPLTQPLR